MTVVEIDYCPRDHQRAFHACDARFRVLVWHRRLGKTTAVINELQRLLIEADSFMPTVGYIAPFQNQARRIAWPLLCHYASALPGIRFNSQMLVAEWENRRFFVLGSDNPDALRGIGLDAAAFDETAQIDPYAWTQVVRPALAERNGRAIFIGTPRGRMNLFHDLWEKALDTEGWWRSMAKASETGILPDDELAALRREMSDNEYEQEFECSFLAAITGAYYAKEMLAAEDEGRVTTVAYDKRYPVIAAMDLGWSDLTVTWYAQVTGNQIWLIDVDAWRHTSLPDIIDDMRSKPYRIDTALVPHDITHTELGTGQSRQEILWSKGLEHIVVPMHKIEDGREAVRAMLPRCAFDRERCNVGVEALAQYRTEYDTLLRVSKRQHVHDWTSHYADGFRYLAFGLPYVDIGDWAASEADYRQVI